MSEFNIGDLVWLTNMVHVRRGIITGVDETDYYTYYGVNDMYNVREYCVFRTKIEALESAYRRFHSFTRGEEVPEWN
jgi:hypothetical protein